jgi:hypothetical protein
MRLYLTVKDLIAILQTQDQDAVVILPGHSDGPDYEPVGAASPVQVFDKVKHDWAGQFAVIFDPSKYEPEVGKEVVKQFIMEPINAVYIH